MGRVRLRREPRAGRCGIRSRELIDGYLRELAAELRLPARIKRRILAEVRAHLEDLAGDAPTPGAQARAIQAFGAPGALARRFGEELALGAGRRAARDGVGVLVLLLALCGLGTSSFLGAPLGWVSDGPGTPLLWITGQVGLVAGVVSLARARIARRGGGLDGARLRYAARGLLVLAVGAGLSAAVAGSGVVVALARGAEPLGPVLGLAVLAGAGAAVSALGAGGAWTAHRRLATLDLVPLSADGLEPLADLLACAQEGASYLARALGRGAGVRAVGVGPAAMPRALRPFDPRRHPWRYATVVALLAGALVPVLDLLALVAKGQLGASRLSDLALTAPALIAFEAALVLAGYASLGPYLGLRPRARR